MAEYIVQDSTLKNIGDAIQEVTSFMPKRPLGDLPETIRAISTVSDYNYKYYGKTGTHVAELQNGRLRFDNYQSNGVVYLYSQDDVKGIYATCSVYDDQGNIYSDWYINEYDLEEEFFDIDALYTFDDGNGWGGVDLGCFFFCSEGSSESLKNHEYGHSLQNAIWGPLFPFVIAVPSAVRYWLINLKVIKVKNYDDIWFEEQATEWGTKTKSEWD